MKKYIIFCFFVFQSQLHAQHTLVSGNKTNNEKKYSVINNSLHEKTAGSNSATVKNIVSTNNEYDFISKIDVKDYFKIDIEIKKEETTASEYDLIQLKKVDASLNIILDYSLFKNNKIVSIDNKLFFFI